MALDVSGKPDVDVNKCANFFVCFLFYNSGTRVARLASIYRLFYKCKLFRSLMFINQMHMQIHPYIKQLYWLHSVHAILKVSKYIFCKQIVQEIVVVVLQSIEQRMAFTKFT